MRSFTPVISICLLLSYLISGAVFGIGPRVMCIEASGSKHVESLGGLCCDNESADPMAQAEGSLRAHEIVVQAAQDTCIDVPLPSDHLPSAQAKVTKTLVSLWLPVIGGLAQDTFATSSVVMRPSSSIPGPSPHLASTVLRI